MASRIVVNVLKPIPWVFSGQRIGVPCAVSNEYKTMAFLRHTIVFGAQNSVLDVISKFFQPRENRVDRGTVTGRHNSGHVLDDHPPRMHPVDEAQVFREKLTALVMHPPLVIVYTERLARWAAHKTIKITPLDPSSLQQRRRADALNWSR